MWFGLRKNNYCTKNTENTNRNATRNSVTASGINNSIISRSANIITITASTTTITTISIITANSINTTKDTTIIVIEITGRVTCFKDTVLGLYLLRSIFELLIGSISTDSSRLIQA